MPGLPCPVESPRPRPPCSGGSTHLVAGHSNGSRCSLMCVQGGCPATHMLGGLLENHPWLFARDRPWVARGCALGCAWEFGVVMYHVDPWPPVERVQGKGSGNWREANRRRQLQTASQPGAMPPPPLVSSGKSFCVCPFLSGVGGCLPVGANQHLFAENTPFGMAPVQYECPGATKHASGLCQRTPHCVRATRDEVMLRCRTEGPSRGSLKGTPGDVLQCPREAQRTGQGQAPCQSQLFAKIINHGTRRCFAAKKKRDKISMPLHCPEQKWVLQKKIANFFFCPCPPLREPHAGQNRGRDAVCAPLLVAPPPPPPPHVSRPILHLSSLPENVP